MNNEVMIAMSILVIIIFGFLFWIITLLQKNHLLIQKEKKYKRRVVEINTILLDRTLYDSWKIERIKGIIKDFISDFSLEIKKKIV